jgi:SAM-dependent methyltransferase
MIARLRKWVHTKLFTLLGNTLAPTEWVGLLGSSAPILSRCLYAAADLGIADQLAQGPRSAKEIAEKTQTDEEAIQRVLRTLVTIGFFSTDKQGRYHNTERSRVLLSHTPQSMRNWVCYAGAEWQWNYWGGFKESVRKGGETNAGRLFDWTTQNPAIREQFNAAMEARATKVDEEIFRHMSFSKYQNVIDVGGGKGHFLARLLAKHPTAVATLFDLPETVTEVQESRSHEHFGNRMQLRSGSFFDSVPKGGDLYVLRHVLHNWSDDKALEILRACRRAMDANGTLLVIDMLLEDDSVAAHCMDVAMLHLLGGKERSRNDFDQLLRVAGFKPVQTRPTDGPFSLLFYRPGQAQMDEAVVVAHSPLQAIP